MTFTIQLPLNVEQAYLREAQTRGVSVDTLVTDVLVSHIPVPGTEQHPELVEEQGIPVLRTGQPLDLAVVEATLDSLHRDRDFLHLGQS